MRVYANFMLPRFYWSMTRYLGAKDTILIQTHMPKIPFVIMATQKDAYSPMQFVIYDQSKSKNTIYKTQSLSYAKSMLRNMVKNLVIKGELTL